VLLNGYRFRWVDVARDEAFIADVLLPELEPFWGRVERREPCSPDASEATKKALRALYPEDDGTVVALPGDLIDADQERVSLKQAIGGAELRLAEIDARLKLAIGDASEGRLANGITYTNKLQKRAAHTVKATEFRVLRRKEPKIREAF